MPSQSRSSSKENKKSSSTLNTKRTGEILSAARKAKGKSIDDVSRAINVRPSILQSIEQGKFFGLTDPLYLKGFIKAYARYLGLNENEVLPFFRREYDEQKHQQQLSQPLSPIEPKKPKVTPGWIVVGCLAAAIIAVVIFSYQQYVSVALTPELTLSKPAENATGTAGQIEVAGQTNPDSTLTLNGQPIQINPNGQFSFSVGLATGTNTLHFESTNKLGKTTTVERSVIGPAKIASQATIQPTTPNKNPTKPSSKPTPTPTSDGVKIEVVIVEQPAWIEVRGDDKPLFSGILLAGSSQAFSASDKIYVKTGNAGSTKILLHGIDQGFMGPPRQVVEKTFK